MIPFTIPLGHKRFAILTLPPEMSEESWQHLVNILNAMRPGLVMNDAQERTAEGRDRRGQDTAGDREPAGGG